MTEQAAEPVDPGPGGFFAILAYEGAEEAGEPPLVMLEQGCVNDPWEGEIRISPAGQP